MADAKICDICGHVITKHEEKESFVQAFGVGLSKFFGGTKEEKRPALHWELNGAYVGRIDLCHDCTIELCTWVEKMQKLWKEQSE